MTEPQFSEEEAGNLRRWSSIMDDYGAWGRLLKYIKLVLAYIVTISAGLVLCKEPILRFLMGPE